MAEKKRRGGGGKLARTENVQVRLDPKLRYAAELAAGKERRTLSSFVEWAVERAVKEVSVTRDKEGNPVSAAEVTDEVWGHYEADRLVGIATLYPELLTHKEQVIWEVIQQEEPLWKTGSLDRSLLRTCWGSILNLAENDNFIDHRLISIFSKGNLKERNIVVMALNNAFADTYEPYDKYPDNEFPILNQEEVEIFKRKFPEYVPFVPQLSNDSELLKKQGTNQDSSEDDSGA